MFKIEQIKTAHSKVKSGADFPAYVEDLKNLGVVYYITYVSDGHTDYFGKNDFKVSSPSGYDQLLNITSTINLDQFTTDLKLHQQGKTDYWRFCLDCAKSGVMKWQVDLGRMTCIYYDTLGNQILEEKIPG